MNEIVHAVGEELYFGSPVIYFDVFNEEKPQELKNQIHALKEKFLESHEETNGINRGLHHTCYGADHIISIWCGLGWVDVSKEFCIEVFKAFGIDIREMINASTNIVKPRFRINDRFIDK